MKFLSVIAATVAMLAPFAAHAQVQASLVAADDSVQPGHPLTVALRLDHESDWHTYWINAGTGYPTKLEWDLPEGWSAGTIQWPTPGLIHDEQGNVTGHGYTDVAYLPVTLTPPASAKSGSQVTLKALAKWLMCADVCIPGKATVTLTLPVSAQSPQPNSGVRADLAKMSMPQALPHDWRIITTRDAREVNLQISSGGALQSPHFFSEDAFIQYDAPQSVVVDGNTVLLRLLISDEASPDTQGLAGVLSYTDAASAYRGVRVDVPFSSGAEGGVQLSAIPGAGSPPSGAALSDGKPPGLAATSSLVPTLFLAVLGGLILNLMPCVFPVLGIKIMGFVNQSANERGKVRAHGLAYTGGVLLSFWVLAGVLALLRAGGEQLGWGFQLQSATFVFGLAIIMLIFAMNLSGVFEFWLGATGLGGNLQTQQGYGGSFFAGVFATVVATPCSAPFLAPALGAALALSPLPSFMVFTAIGLGLSAPYLLLSVFPQAVKVLPRPGRWMETFKQASAFALYGTVAWLIWVLAGQVGENALLSAMLGLTVIAIAVWLYGRYHRPEASVRQARMGLVAGLVVFLAGAWLGWPRADVATDIVWEPWSTERVAQLRDADRPIYVDFTARWCATCQANKKIVFTSPAVKRYFRDRHVATLKADWTNADPRITTELAKWHRSAVPFNLVYRPGDPEPKVLPEILTPGIVLSAFGEAP